jgi:hypothetical protein
MRLASPGVGARNLDTSSRTRCVGEELGVFIVAPAQPGFQRFYRRSILSTLVSAGSRGRWRTSVALGVGSSLLEFF